MSRSLNKVQLIGNLTQDPEVRQTPGGQNVCSIGVATNRRWTDSSGQRQEKAEFHNIVFWGKLAEIVGQYLKKGSKIYVEGRLETRNWEAQDGTKRYRTEVIAESMIMLDSKGSGGGDFLNEFAQSQASENNTPNSQEDVKQPKNDTAKPDEEVVTLEADTEKNQAGANESKGIDVNEIPF